MSTTSATRSVMTALVILGVLVSPHSLFAEADENLDNLKQEAMGFVQIGDWEEALESYSQLTEAEPDNAQHWAFLGLAHRNLENYNLAIAAFETALGLDATNSMAQGGLAITFEKLGDIDAAFRYLTQAVENGVSPQILQGNPSFEDLRQHEQFAGVLAVAERAANPCQHEDPYDNFDFWTGDWDVLVGGQKRAENLITKEMNGCIIRERYHNDFGYQGESINYYDPESGQWKQNWVDGGGGIVRYQGGLEKEGVMVMEGANTTSKGTTQLARVTWTLLEDGSLHHVILQSPDGGKTWSTYFDAIYVKSDRPTQVVLD